MEVFKSTHRSFFTWTVLLSFVYNLFWLVLFVFFLMYSVASPLLITMIFLFFYLVIAQYIKDLFFLSFYKRFIYRTHKKITHIEQKISSVNTTKDFEVFLSILVKEWRLDGLRFFYYFPQPIVLFVSSKGRTKTIGIKKVESVAFVRYIKNNSFPANLSDFPLELQNELREKEVQSLAPIVQHDTLFGFLAFRNFLSGFHLQVASIICQRFAVVFENELFRKQLPTYKMLEQEFDTAYRVEKLLQLKSGIQIYNYAVNYQNEVWEKKHFPVLFDVYVPKQNGKNKHGFVMLVRLNNTSTRAKALQLFIAQGYFYSLTQTNPDLKKLVTSLHELLRDRENGKILLDGIIAEIFPSGKMRLQYFGNNISIAIDEDLFPLQSKPCLGSEKDFPFEAQNIPACEQLEFFIQKYSLLQLQRKTT